ncbi:hypothetical protein Vadar_009972 [Vaccinium darrowii]|uniref:Uncharacterized protein n=1 Tax=Vaccinium darrowii TaxID=229202 RepID=A0ACB7XPK1_9ERIC|nr:hypothetical protein Vadar_009972 [Vaccinium darrowii]
MVTTRNGQNNHGQDNGQNSGANGQNGVPDLTQLLQAIAAAAANLAPQTNQRVPLRHQMNRSQMLDTFCKRQPPVFYGEPDPAAAEAWLKQITKLLEGKGKVGGSTTGGPVRTNHNQSNNRGYAAKPYYQNNQRPQQQNQPWHPGQGQGQNQARGRNNETVRCFNCQELGHFKSHCPKPPRQNNNYGGYQQPRQIGYGNQNPNQNQNQNQGGQNQQKTNWNQQQNRPYQNQGKQGANQNQGGRIFALQGDEEQDPTVIRVETLLEHKLFYVSVVYGMNLARDRVSLWRDLRMLSLLEMITKGYWYTWTNKRGGHGSNKSRLDRVLISNAWLDLFRDSEVVAHALGIFDHCVLVLTVLPFKFRAFPFRFYNFWMTDGRFKDILVNSWVESVEGSPMHQISSKLRRLKPLLKSFHRKNFSNLSGRVAVAKENLSKIQDICFKFPHDTYLRDLEKDLVLQYYGLSAVEESYKK